MGEPLWRLPLVVAFGGSLWWSPLVVEEGEWWSGLLDAVRGPLNQLAEGGAG